VMDVGESKIEVTTPVLPLTVRVVEPLWPLKAAPIVELPPETPVARPGLACPVDSTDATAEFEEDQVEELVTSLVDPSL
jgi:hypothetical protein